jgi:hypothetical protein
VPTALKLTFSATRDGRLHGERSDGDVPLGSVGLRQRRVADTAPAAFVRERLAGDEEPGQLLASLFRKRRQIMSTSVRGGKTQPDVD